MGITGAMLRSLKIRFISCHSQRFYVHFGVIGETNARIRFTRRAVFGFLA